MPSAVTSTNVNVTKKRGQNKIESKQFSSSGTCFSMGTSRTDFLSLLVPCEYPTAFAAGDGTVGDANDLANVRNAHCLQRLPLGIADVIERMTLRHEEVTAPPFQLSHAAAREAANPLALLIIDIVPVLRLFDIRYLLAKSSCSYCQQK